MTSLKPLPPAMIRDIDAFLAQQRERCIAVYGEAEKIRLKWEEQNIALEDVISVLVERCGMHDVAVSFDRRDEAVILMQWEAERSDQRKHG